MEGARAERRAQVGLVLGPSEALPGHLAAWAEARLQSGERLFVVQFLCGSLSAPLSSLSGHYADRFEVRAMGPDDPGRVADSAPVDAKWAADGVSLAARALRKGPWDQVALLQADAVVRLGLLELDRILELLDCRPPDRGLLFLCSEAPPELLEAVEQVVRLPEPPGGSTPRVSPLGRST